MEQHLASCCRQIKQMFLHSLVIDVLILFSLDLPTFTCQLNSNCCLMHSFLLHSYQSRSSFTKANTCVVCLPIVFSMNVSTSHSNRWSRLCTLALWWAIHWVTCGCATHLLCPMWSIPLKCACLRWLGGRPPQSQLQCINTLVITFNTLLRWRCSHCNSCKALTLTQMTWNNISRLHRSITWTVFPGHSIVTGLSLILPIFSTPRCFTIGISLCGIMISSGASTFLVLQNWTSTFPFSSHPLASDTLAKAFPIWRRSPAKLSKTFSDIWLLWSLVPLLPTLSLLCIHLWISITLRKVLSSMAMIALHSSHPFKCSMMLRHPSSELGGEKESKKWLTTGISQNLSFYKVLSRPSMPLGLQLSGRLMWLSMHTS